MILLPGQSKMVWYTVQDRVQKITRIRPPLSIVNYCYIFLKLVLMITHTSTGSDLFFQNPPVELYQNI